MRLLDRVRAVQAPTIERSEWNPNLWPGLPGGLAFDGLRFTLSNSEIKEVSATLPGYLDALRNCPPAFAAQLVRANTVSQARFTYRRKPWVTTGKAREIWGDSSLALLETPWPGGNTADLISRMEWHEGLAGNSYTYRQNDRLRVLRPDWVTLIYGSQQDPDFAAHALDGDLLGFMYTLGGAFSGGRSTILLPEEVAHCAPIPDPSAGGIGMSWLTPVIREIQGDVAAADFKVNFFRNGATPNLVIKGLTAPTQKQFLDLIDQIETSHSGVANAYKTLYLGAGADATVVGSSLKEMDFKSTQGTGETRISVASRVPAVVLGISEGLSGSSLNAGNFGQARRSFADTWVYGNLADKAQSLATIIDVPGGSELWFDTTDIPILREDAKDAADIANVQAQMAASLIREGWTAESIVKFLISYDPADLEHSGLVSVQMQTPGTWHGVQDAPAGPVPAPLAADTASETKPKAVPATPAQAAAAKQPAGGPP